MIAYLKKNKIWLIPLVLIFLAGFILRIYRLDELLGFFYDQARDALVIHDLIYNHKLTLIGPTSGIEGIFLGPFYYYLITPAYLLSGGNPTIGASWVGFVNSLGIILGFYVAKRLFNIWAGFITALFFAFSYDAISFSRWFSNPSPIPFFVFLILLCLINLKDKKSPLWGLVLGLSLGLSLQLEAAAAIWFVPATILAMLVLRIKLSKKWLFGSLCAFLATLVPQVLFDLKHHFLLTNAFYSFLIEEKSFKTTLFETISKRLPFYLETFSVSLRLNSTKTLIILILALATLALGFGKKFLSKEYKFGFYLCLIWVGTVLVGLIFYQGNNGYVWSYYLSGAIPVFYLFLAGALSLWLKKLYLAPFALFFVLVFLVTNITIDRDYLTQLEPEGETINFTNQKWSMDYIYQDAKTQDFNVDAYVPPVIPHTYDYLQLWYGQKNYGFVPKKDTSKLLYTIEEIDPPHPDRLKAFQDRQNSFSKVIQTTRKGGITVEKRLRL